MQLPYPRLFLLLVATLFLLVGSTGRADTLDEIRQRGKFIWGADSEGGGPYIFFDPDDPQRMVGFEVDLAEALAREMQVGEEFFQGSWEILPAILKTGKIDLILNGYELTGARLGRMAATLPYYKYEFALLARRDNQDLQDWDDLGRSVNGRKSRIGVLTGSAAHHYLEERFGDSVQLLLYDGNLNAMQEVVNGKLDATVADLPVVVFYADRYPELRQIGASTGGGYYVIYVRQGDERLRDALNEALLRLMQSGQLKQIYERYGLWSDAQEQLVTTAQEGAASLGVDASRITGWEAIRSRSWFLLQGAGMTALLACCSMPLAILIGLGVALGRLYGPAPIRWLMIAYVEILRGTPLLLQLYVIFFVLPEFGIEIQPFYSSIAGLAINYSAYEAEIYRAGLQAIPRGQMEAALSLGMSPALALRRIIVPQAMRIVVPPMTNDFIALFKDTSVCSVITVVELTKQYSIHANDTGATLELAALTGLLYLLMSLPLAKLAAVLEARMRPKPGR